MDPGLEHMVGPVCLLRVCLGIDHRSWHKTLPVVERVYRSKGRMTWFGGERPFTYLRVNDEFVLKRCWSAGLNKKCFKQA